MAGPGAIVRTAARYHRDLSIFGARPDVIFGNTTASNTTAISTNFNVATQETSAFYDGFLKPIDLQTLDDFVRQDYSRELLFWLFTDTVELKIGGHTLGMRYDPPNDYGCDRTIRDAYASPILFGLRSLPA